MAQGFLSTIPVTGSDLVSADIRRQFNALATLHLGPQEPGDIQEGQPWIDTSDSSNVSLRIYYGGVWRTVIEHLERPVPIPAESLFRIAMSAETTQTILEGDAVYLSEANRVKLARATADATSWVYGLADEDIPPTESGRIRVGGVGAFNPASGQFFSGGSRVYLSEAEAGKCRASDPGPPYWSSLLGIAVSSTEVLLRPQVPVENQP